MYILYKLTVDTTAFGIDASTKAKVKLIAPFHDESECTRVCNIMNSENHDSNSTYKYGYLKDNFLQ